MGKDTHINAALERYPLMALRGFIILRRDFCQTAAGRWAEPTAWCFSSHKAVSDADASPTFYMDILKGIHRG